MEDEKSIKRFKREVKVISNTVHENIIKILHYNLDHNPPYFVMPLAKASIYDLIKDIKGDIKKALKIFEGTCKGLIALHSSGKYHRDIKPSNILVIDEGTVVLSDFGLAKLENSDSTTHTSSNHFLGTVGYHAPEQLKAKDADARTDIFQLGKCFYEIYTGDAPYLINLKEIPFGLAYIIQKATAPDPDERYQSVNEFLQAIKTYEKSLSPKKNPREALENKLIEIKKLLANGEYIEDFCTDFINLLGENSDDIDLFIEYFDKIPTQILEILVSKLDNKFESILIKYTGNLSIYFAEHHFNFSYAEVVADKMSVIFNTTNKLTFKAISLRNLLRAAVLCNRFNAMDTFNHLLQKIKNNEEAGLIAQVLEEEIKFYSEIADQLADNNLHSTIALAKNNALAYKNAKKKHDDIDINEWLKTLGSST